MSLEHNFKVQDKDQGNLIKYNFKLWNNNNFVIEWDNYDICQDHFPKIAKFGKSMSLGQNAQTPL